ncbi:MAG: NADH-quinone oxidoreductase subunit J [Candidatus Omnitrophota bacterium]|nr:NADH-quinone oxidoreductase subunit J [Candidatus Omnitrophota bacterium]
MMSRSIFHSAVYLAFALIGVACIYLYLDAEFLAIVQILIYVGAIVTLFIFTIMLTARADNTGSIREAIKRMWAPSLASLAIFLILIKVIAMTTWHIGLPKAEFVTLQGLGRSLMSKYVLPFEVISLISLAALVGAIVIGKGRKR